MKKALLIAAMVAVGATGAFAQGTITFKTSGAKNPVYYATDGTTGSLTELQAGNQAGSMGTITYDLLVAPTGTPGLAAADYALLQQTGVAPVGWTIVPVGNVTVSTPGTVSPVTITLPSADGAAGANVELGAFAYTGSSLTGATLYSYSGDAFAGGNTVSSGTLTTSTGAFSWTQPTGNPNTTPAGTPGTIPTGAAGFGSLVLQPVPEPGTMALCGLGAASLLLFRRRK